MGKQECRWSHQTVYPRKNKDGKVIGYRGSYFVQTADGPKRRYVSGKTQTKTEKALMEARADVARGITFDAGMLTLGKYLDHWLRDYLEPLMNQGKMEHST